MANLSMGGFSVQDGTEGQTNLPMALAGAVGGALAVGVIYGLVGRFVGEFAYVAFLIGAASGTAAMKLGGGRSIVAGIVAAGASLVAVLGAKLIVGAPEGVSWISYHTTMFDILFCYVLNPVAAFFAAGTNKARQLLEKLPI
jgi:hypothetical protein